VNIAASFLSETVFTTLLGGIVGIGLALGGGVILERFGQIPMIFSAKIWGLALGLSLLVGITFGLRPALKAARIDPIKAIRG
jgi:putative ABC transport system permease protein